MSSSEMLICEECGAIFSTIELLMNIEKPKEKTKNCVMPVLQTVNLWNLAVPCDSVTVTELNDLINY